MQTKTALFSVLTLAVLLSGACTKKKEQASVPQKRVTVLHQSNRGGELEPCGCDSNPYGGLDREMNAVLEARKENPVLYVDAGNMFLTDTKRPVSYYQEKAKTMASMLDTIGLDAYAPSSKDFLLGKEFLKELAAKSKFKWISSNIHDEKGAFAFEPYIILERGGSKFAMTGAAMSGKKDKSGFTIQPASEALNKLLPEMRAKSDFVVLLSQLSIDENEKLARALDINVLVGADPSYSNESPLWYQNGKTLVIDTAAQGHRLGKLDLEIAMPFKGFTSPAAVVAALEDVFYSKELLKKKPNDKGLKTHIATVQKSGPMELIDGGTEYSHELLKLDAQRFGKPNSITALLAQEKERIRQKALSE